MILSDWINDKYLNPKKLSLSYKRGKPYHHLQLKGFLKDEKAAMIEDALRKHAFTHKESDLFKLSQTINLNYSKDPVIGAFRTFLRSRAFSEYMHAVTNITLYNTDLDIAGALYTDTDFLLCHDDQLQGRRIAFIFYLCEEFKQHDGGALALLDTKKVAKKNIPGKVVKRLYPTWNTLSFFTVSPISWHAVEEVTSHKERLSIGGWLH